MTHTLTNTRITAHALSYLFDFCSFRSSFAATLPRRHRGIRAIGSRAVCSRTSTFSHYPPSSLRACNLLPVILSVSTPNGGGGAKLMLCALAFLGGLLVMKACHMLFTWVTAPPSVDVPVAQPAPRAQARANKAISPETLHDSISVPEEPYFSVLMSRAHAFIRNSDSGRVPQLRVESYRFSSKCSKVSELTADHMPESFKARFPEECGAVLDAHSHLRSNDDVFKKLVKSYASSSASAEEKAQPQFWEPHFKDVLETTRNSVNAIEQFSNRCNLLLHRGPLDGEPLSTLERQYLIIQRADFGSKIDALMDRYKITKSIPQAIEYCDQQVNLMSSAEGVLHTAQSPLEISDDEAFSDLVGGGLLAILIAFSAAFTSALWGRYRKKR